MLAAVTRSPGELVIEDVSGPGRARPGHVIVQPEAVGICGSDFHLFSGDVGAGEQVVVFGAGPIGSSCATAGDFRAAVRMVTANRAVISALFSHHFPLARAAEAIEFAMRRPPDAIKIVVTVN